MHISEGVLNPEILIGGVVVSLAFTTYALKKLKNEEIPLVAVFSALFFLASFIHVPAGPVSIHLILNGIIGAILGVRAFIAIFIALLLQGVLFGYGGISTLGINTLNLALPSLLGWYILSLHVKSISLKKVQYFLVGFTSVFVSALFLSITLALNGESFIDAAKVAFLAHIPVMLIEGVITMFALMFLDRVYPQIFKRVR
ncbi:MAG TPA: cobalt transporter CbiM [Sulfurospirillum arcachonense]|nr:cobalt transporter CbiM [Sulfurospirillum arcachonense]HIP45845.1 cobalt transporter CbiM [Sulfurospirillum arcachonense]